MDEKGIWGWLSREDKAAIEGESKDGAVAANAESLAALTSIFSCSVCKARSALRCTPRMSIAASSVPTVLLL